MTEYQVVLDEPAEDDPEPEQDLAWRLFGDDVRPRRIVNSELGIYPMDDED